MKKIKLAITIVDRERNSQLYSLEGTPRSCFFSFQELYLSVAPRVKNRMGSGGGYDLLFPVGVINHFLIKALDIAKGETTIDVRQDYSSLKISAEVGQKLSDEVGLGKIELDNIAKEATDFAKRHVVKERQSDGLYFAMIKTDVAGKRKKQYFIVRGVVLTASEKAVWDAVQSGKTNSVVELEELIPFSQGYISRVLASLKRKGLIK